MMATVGRVRWQCPRCPFYVTGNPTDAILAEMQRSHDKRHRVPAQGAGPRG